MPLVVFTCMHTFHWMHCLFFLSTACLKLQCIGEIFHTVKITLVNTVAIRMNCHFKSICRKVTYENIKLVNHTKTSKIFCKTQEQYGFLYEAVLEALLWEDTAISVSHLSAYWTHLQEVDGKTGRSYISQQFQVSHKLNKSCERWFTITHLPCKQEQVWISWI